MCAEEKDFLQSNLFLRSSRTPEELLSGAPFRLEVKWGCSSVVLIFARASKNLQKGCSAENPSPGRNPRFKRIQTDASFKKALYENDLKIENKPLNLRPPPILVRLSR
jgi:hypothetical protein